MTHKEFWVPLPTPVKVGRLLAKSPLLFMVAAFTCLFLIFYIQRKVNIVAKFLHVPLLSLLSVTNVPKGGCHTMSNFVFFGELVSFLSEC